MRMPGMSFILQTIGGMTISHVLDVLMKNVEVPVKFKKIHPKAVIPEYKSSAAAGFDFHAVVESGVIEIPRGTWKLIDTGLSVEIPVGYEIQVRPRSGLALRHGIQILNTPGTVDADYRGPLKIMLMNHGEKTFQVRQGDRIAQGVVASVPPTSILEVEKLSDTERGEKGFGSTGVQ